MVVRYQLVGPDDADKEAITRCGVRAFADDEFQKHVFPARLAHFEEPGAEHRFRMQRLDARLRTKGCQYIIAVDDDVDDGKRVLGFAGWFAPGSAKRVHAGDDGVLKKDLDEEDYGGVDDGNGGRRGDGKKFPAHMDVDLHYKLAKVEEAARKEYLGENENNVWCESIFASSL